MKNLKILSILGLAWSGAATAAVDYSHCMSYLKSHAPQSSYYGEYWTLTDGEIKKLASDPAGSYSINNGVHEWKTTGALGKDIDYVTRLETKDGGLSRLRFTVVDEKRDIVLNFSTKNGICYPINRDDVGKDTTHSMYNTDLCHDLKEFFEKNPESKKCSCGTNDTNQRLEKLMSKYTNVYDFKESEDIEQISAKVKGWSNSSEQSGGWAVLNKISGSLGKAFSYLGSCQGTDGVRSALVDNRIWAKPGAAVSSETGQPPAVDRAN